MIALEYPTELAQWIPVPKNSQALTRDQLEGWAIGAAERVHHLRGADDLKNLALSFLKVFPSPEEVDRIVFISNLGGPNALVEFATRPHAEGSRERLVTEWTKGSDPIRPIEIDDVELGDLSESFRLVYASEREGELAIVMGFAGVIHDSVVSATCYCRSPMTAAELAEAMPVFFSRLEVANESDGPAES